MRPSAFRPVNPNAQLTTIFLSPNANLAVKTGAYGSNLVHTQEMAARFAADERSDDASYHDTPYLALLKELAQAGPVRADRTGVGAVSLFGRQMRFDLSAGFPLLTTKRVFFKAVEAELLWFLSGDTNARALQAQGVSIWDEWADPDTGELGRIYGAQWRRWRGADGREVDQIATLVEGLRRDPFSRRHVVTAWNPAELGDMALPPCHCLFQAFVSEAATGRRQLSVQLYQRSADIFLGVPFNIASYALLTHMLAQVCGYEPGEFVITLGDVHLYANHLEQARAQLARAPRPSPRLALAPRERLEDFRPGDARLEGYDPHPAIKAPVAI